MSLLCLQLFVLSKIQQKYQAIKGCDEAFQLNDHKRDVLLYLESRMSIFCPNLATLLSPSIAAKLVTAAGGLMNLSRMPAQNIMLIGAQKRAMLGMAGHNNHGLVLQCDLIQGTRPEHRARAIRYSYFVFVDTSHLTSTRSIIF